MADISEVDELVASMMTDLMYWQSLDNIDSNETKCSLIYKILQCIRASDPNAYEPRALSIGPYHHGSPALLPMDIEKWLCLDYVLKLNCNRSLHDYLEVITSLEREVRICYSEDNLMDRRTFIEMLLLDSCFILVCLNGIGGIMAQGDVSKEYSQEQDTLTEVRFVQTAEPNEKVKETNSESIPTLSCRASDNFVLQIEQIEVNIHQENIPHNTLESYCSQSKEKIVQEEQWYNSSAVYDLLLLENQIPFFVVTKIFDLLVDDHSTTYRLLTDNLAKFIEGVLLHMPSAIQGINRPKNFDHLLHLCYMYFKPSVSTHHRHQVKEKDGYFRKLLCWGIKYFGNSNSRENEENLLPNANFKATYCDKQLKRWRRAEEYHEAGVEFTEVVFDEHNPHSLLDIEFRNGTLHIPCLAIDDKFGTLFRNLLAFEQSCPALGNDLASYVYFMSQLISVPDDVALLSRKGIIVHQLDSDEEVSTLFSKLFEYVVFDFYGEHYLKTLSHTMEAHYQNRVNRWMSWLWHKHFGNPWLGLTALASVFMVFCSIGQTVLAFLSYMNTS